MTATILILEYATILYVSPSRPTRDEALDEACFRFMISDTHNVIHEQFGLSPESYSALQFTEFALTHRLR